MVYHLIKTIYKTGIFYTPFLFQKAFDMPAMVVIGQLQFQIGQHSRQDEAHHQEYYHLQNKYDCVHFYSLWLCMCLSIMPIIPCIFSDTLRAKDSPSG